jgi:hypothetical protein
MGVVELPGSGAAPAPGAGKAVTVDAEMRQAANERRDEVFIVGDVF